MNFIWAGIAFVAIIIDLITSTFIFVCFSAGAFAALLAAISGAEVSVQVLIFLMISAVCIIFAYPKMKKLLSKTVTETLTPEDLLVGKEFTLEEDLMEIDTIKIEGIFRTVKNMGEPVKKGEKIVIVGLEGAKLLVKKAD